MSVDRRTVIASGLFAASPLKALAQSNVHWDGIPRLMQGPVLGWCASTEATVWTRASGAYAVSIQYDKDPRFSSPQVTAAMTAKADDDFTQVHRLTGLTPGETYAYRVLINGKPNPDEVGFEPHRLRAASVGPSRFRMAFGSCARRARYPVQPIWKAVEQAQPDLFIWAGDAVYADSPDPAIVAEEYRRQRDLPEIRPFMASVPQLAIWDDHDYGLNDHDRRHPQKDGALKVFKQYWPNPAAGLTGVPGTFFKHSQGGVDFFFLDVRYNRDPNMDPDTPLKTMLGKAQFDWLLSGLRASKAPFKVLVSGAGWSDAKAVGADSWASFTHERDRLFSLIMQENITGVILLSGDTHFGEMNCLPWSDKGGYDLYEFVSSPLAQDTEDLFLDYRPILRVRQAYPKDVNFGVVDFDLTLSDPTVTFDLRDEGGQSVWAPVTVRASDLTLGQISWPKTLDTVSKLRWERFVATGRYY
jgi:alkaline phosphatase D